MDEKSVYVIQTLASQSGARAGTATRKDAEKTAPNDVAICPVCQDTGWRPISSATDRRVVRCDCFLKKRARLLLTQARIPARFGRCEISNYDGKHPSQQRAKMTAEAFVQQYPIDKAGLLILGSLGVGKTHLAVAIMKELITQKGINCLFVDYAELLKEIQGSYNPGTEATELAILRPVFDADVLVIDELGSQKPTQWVLDTVSFILNTRYNENKTTIFTTNRQDEPALLATEYSQSSPNSKANAAVKEDTLGDRIGERTRSRLHEMCRTVEVTGEDRRSLR